MADLTITPTQRALLHAEATFDDSTTGVPVPIAWTTSDDTIVSIGEGGYLDDPAGNVWVFAHNEGTATVTATSGDVLASFDVEVNDGVEPPQPPKPVASLTITVLAVA